MQKLSERAGSVFWTTGPSNIVFICSVFQLLTADFKSIEKFENRRFTLKTHQMFSVNKTSEKFENTTESTVSLDFCLSKNRQGNRIVIVTSKCLPSTLKCKAGVFKFLQFEDLERFQKLRFGEGLAWTEGLTVEIQFRFHISPPYIYSVYGASNKL